MEVDGVIASMYSKQSGKDDHKLRNHDGVLDKSTIVKPIGANFSRSRKRKRMSLLNLGSCTNSLSTEEDDTMKVNFLLHSRPVTRNHVENNTESQDELLPPREELRPQHGLPSHINKIVVRGQLHSAPDDDQETSAEKIGQDEVENGNNVEYRDGYDGKEEAGVDGDGEEDAGVDGDGEDEDEGEDEGAEEGEVPEVKRRYDLRKRAVVRRKDVEHSEDDDGVGDDDGEDEGKNEEEEEGDDEEVEQPEVRRRRNRADSRISVEVKQRARSPRRVLHQGMGTKANREVRKNGSRVNKQHRVTQEEEDSDDSLLLDEFDQGPPTPWSMGGTRSGPPWLLGGLDVDGTPALGLNVAASGWGHQSDNLSSGIQTAGPSSKGGADIQPVQVDESVSFDEIGGLSEYIDALKEMVFFPLLYPDFFASYNITPPRGVLLSGPPGTGKTLIARALAGAASKAGQKVSFYMRKGADVLSKWVGEAERQLKLLFEEAQRNQPSIIFFDEIDGLAPVRSSKQEQIHNSIVSTLLALMDGLDSRGQVVLIGATNRVDSIDGALRRPGRFDREFNFPLPGLEARVEILDIHTRKWKKPPSNELKLELAGSCVGYCGADLKALCTEAAIRAFREKYPQVYTCDDKFIIDVDSVNVERLHFTEAMSTITPAAHRGSIVHSRPLSSIVAPCLQSQLQKAMNIVSDIFPFATQSKSTKISMPSHGSFISLVYRPRLLLCGGEGVGLDHVGPALLHELEKIPVHSLDLPSLLSDPGARTPEEALVHIFREARRTTPSILYLPQFHFWWENAPEQLKAVLLSLLEELPSGLPILLLGTSSVQLDDLPDKAFAVFSMRNIFSIEPPSPEDRSAFITRVIEAALSIDTEDVTQTSKGTKSLHELPKAPKVAYAPKASEIKAKAESQSHALRRMRMCLRDVCNRILIGKRFSAFHYPVMDEDEPNYRLVIKNPMDMSTLLQRVDSGCYLTRKAFLKDLDLIWVNSKKYYGDDYKGARIVSSACELRDAVLGMLNQMDPALVSACEKIAEEGGPVSVPEEFEGLFLSQTPVLAQMTTLTQSSARVHNVQPEVNQDLSCEVLKKQKKKVDATRLEVNQSREVLKKQKKKVDATRLDQGGLGNLQAECIQPEIPVITSVSSSKHVTMSDKVETIKQQLMEHTKTYGIPELERLYGRIMKGVFETKHAAVMREELRLRSAKKSKKEKIRRSSALNFLLKLAQDEANFQCN